MFQEDYLDEVAERKRRWKETTLKRSLERFGVERSPNQLYTPLDIPHHSFLSDVGFPGEYPFTSSTSSCFREADAFKNPRIYSGYGLAEDTRDYFKSMLTTGRGQAPFVAFDLPTQIGMNSDEPMARGEVGKTGVAVDSLRDFEIIYEAFVGDHDLDTLHSNWVMNAPANIILAMYLALGEQRGIPFDQLGCVVQNDILKEFVARGMYIFPPEPSLRLVRDTIVFCTRQMPLSEPIMMGGVQFREAGATGPETLGIALAHAAAYIQLGLDAGLGIDEFAPKLGFVSMGGSMEMLYEIALHRAVRRMWARLLRERFGARDPESWKFRTMRGAMIGNSATTAQRPLNNLTRTVIGAIASALSGGGGELHPGYDEPLGLGYSLEARQLMRDGERIIKQEAKLCDIIDPLAGSYYIEWLTDSIERDAWQVVEDIEKHGGAVACVESGYTKRRITRSAYEYQHKLETGQIVIVGVNRFLGENELEVLPSRAVPHPYDPARRQEAEDRQIAKLKALRKERDNGAVAASLARLKEAAGDQGVNTIPPLLEAVKTYATIGEITKALTEVFGEYREFERA
ncbi:MAG: methylmalonyl-CoA mutase [Chloroflexi bacterium]|nr:methylmalonyl-CoA mutase [Chloroflexota bacterium]